MSYEAKELCTKAKELLKKEMTNISYETWIKNIEIQKITNDTITILVSATFHKDTLKNRYYDLIFNTFKFLTNKEYKIEFLSMEDVSKDDSLENLENSDDSHINNSKINTSLNPKYTFETFVVGNNNRFAHAASLAVAESPATSYNPLFLYGGVGLGKTHLMHAIGNKILSNNPSSKILYVTSEKFTNQLINAIKDAKTEAFRNKYRYVDVLLIDDIQFIAGKERIQEEFFHTFNSLHEDGKQIILSSDRPPREIQLLEDRLVSRFEWGLIADISNPDYETRLAILRKKAETDNVVVDDDILSNIANRVSSNIRELEGVFNKLVAFSTLSKGPITIEMAEKAINDISSQNNNVISSDYIQEEVAKYFNINKKDLKSSKRSNNIAYPRQIAMYLCRELANMSFPKIGEDFGNRDHTTVMHGCNKIEKEIENNTNTKLIVESVQKMILEKKSK
jgi:chromosomal replication initiator protein